MEWFADWIRARIEEAGDNESSVARRIGVLPSYVHHWRNGRKPTLYQAEMAFKAYGGDIRRALPEFEILDETVSIIEGSVTANSGQFSVDTEKRRIHGGPLGYFKESRLYTCTHGPHVLLRVDGTSMEPDYPNGSLLVCRKPASPTHLPNNAPVIARIGESSTFKLLQRKDPKTILLVPLNVKEHDVQIYSEKEVSIDLVVLGRLIPNEYAPTRNNGSPRTGVLRSARTKSKKDKLPDVEV